MATNTREGPTAFGHDGRAVMRAAGAEIGKPFGECGFRRLCRCAQPTEPVSELFLQAKSRQALADDKRQMIDREGRARRQQRLAAFVELAGEPRPAVGIDGEQDACDLILDQRPLLLDYEDFFGAGTCSANELGVERPRHADAAEPDPQLLQSFGPQPKQFECLHDIRLRFADRDDHQPPPAGTGIDQVPVKPVGAAKGDGCGQSNIEQPSLLLERTVRPPNGNVGRETIGRDDRGRDAGKIYGRGRIHRVGQRLHSDPHARRARHRPAKNAEAKHLGHVRRLQHRDRRIEKRVIRLRRQARRLAGMVVTGDRQHTAKPGGAGGVGMLEHVAGAIDAGALGVPDRKHAITRCAGRKPELLAAPHAGCRQILVEAGLKHHVVAVEMALGRP